MSIFSASVLKQQSVRRVFTREDLFIMKPKHCLTTHEKLLNSEEVCDDFFPFIWSQGNVYGLLVQKKKKSSNYYDLNL